MTRTTLTFSLGLYLKLGLSCFLLFYSFGFSQSQDLYQIAQDALSEARASQRNGSPNQALWQDVITASQAVLAEDLSHPQANIMIAEAYETLGLQNLAWRSWQMAWLETDDRFAFSKSKVIGHQLAEASLSAKLFDSATKYYTALLEIDSKDIRIFTGLANIAYAQNNLAKVEHYLRIALSLEPSNKDLLTALSNLKTLQTEPVAVVEETAETVSVSAVPEAPAPLTPVGTLESVYGERAASAYREGLRLYDAGLPFEARLLFIDAVEFAPEFIDAWLWLGRTRFEQESFELAAQAYQRALDLDPSNASISQSLAEARANQ